MYTGAVSHFDDSNKAAIRFLFEIVFFCYGAAQLFNRFSLFYVYFASISLFAMSFNSHDIVRRFLLNIPFIKLIGIREKCMFSSSNEIIRFENACLFVHGNSICVYNSMYMYIYRFA